MNETLFNIILVLWIAIMTIWVYCIWFHNKYDKNTNRLILLIFFNVYYVPFYLFRIKKIRKENRIKALSEEIYDTEFIDMTRQSVINTLKLWSSKEKQIRFQMDLERSDHKELIMEWIAVYNIEERVLEEAFNETEQNLLNTFNHTIRVLDEKKETNQLSIEEFQNTNDWNVTNKMAIEVLKVIKKNNV